MAAFRCRSFLDSMCLSLPLPRVPAPPPGRGGRAPAAGLHPAVECWEMSAFFYMIMFKREKSSPRGEPGPMTTAMTATTERPPRRVRWLFLFATLCFWCSMYTYVPILSPYLEHIGFRYSLIGIVLGSYGFMQLLVRFPLGLWSEIGRASCRG